MKTRIVTDVYAGFEVQVKYWWFPFGYRKDSQTLMQH